jgi:predicted O-linked N-acetylglucosamine transferase (SPINDLY family)
MNKLMKHSNEIRKIWKEIIDENENVVLYVKRDEDMRLELDNFYKEFPRDKLVFLPFSNTLEKYLSKFNEIDFCIDTYPYSGTTTTCTSLYMGVPVFTVYDEKNEHVSNVTGSILLNMGKDEYIGENMEEYKKKINDYIKNYKVHGNSEREKLKEEFLQLMNPEKFMKEYEDVLENTLEKYDNNVN